MTERTVGRYWVNRLTALMAAKGRKAAAPSKKDAENGNDDA